MTTNTATQVQPGTSITLSCQLSPLPYPQQCRTAVFVNSSQLSLSYGRSSSTTFLVRAYGKHTFTCKEICDPTKKLICGLDVESGSKEDVLSPCSEAVPVAPLSCGLGSSSGWPFPEEMLLSGGSFKESLRMEKTSEIIEPNH